MKSTLSAAKNTMCIYKYKLRLSILAPIFLVACAFFAGAGIPLPCHATDKLSESREKLQQVQEQIGSTSKKIEQKKATERSALQRLEELERNISISDRQLHESSAALDELKEKIHEILSVRSA